MHASAAALLLGLCAPLAAQTALQFSQLRKTTHLDQVVTGYANVAGDFDGDGDVDVFLGCGSTDNRMLWNDGRARFRLAYITSTVFDATRAVAAADLNADRYLDVVVGNLGPDILWLNNGLGGFVQRALPPDSDDTNAVAVGDVDGDGDVDIVFGNGSEQAGRQNRLYLNDGKAGFTDVTATLLPAETDTTQAVALGDVDGDGDLDLFAGNGSPILYRRGETNKLYLNDGKGRFAVSTGYFDRFKQPTNAVLLIDVDGDRDLDLVEANGDLEFGSQPFLTNCHRQLRATSLARLGDSYGLEVMAEPGYAPGNLFAIPFASLLRFPTRLRIEPFGWFALHPLHTIIGPVVVIPATGPTRGTLAMTWPLPSIASLHGQTLTSQALVLHGTSASDWRFTNATSDPILR